MWKEVKANLKFAAIQKNDEKYPIKTMCEFFKVSRSGYYEYIKQGKELVRDEDIKKIIIECHNRCGRTYGYRRVKIWIKREKKLNINHKKLLRIMNKYALLSEIRRRRKYKFLSDQIHRYPNILNRDFKADKPNSKWVTDISYIHTEQGILYLSIIKDLYDNSIVSYKTGTNQSINLVLRTIRTAMEQEKDIEGLRLHSDQGLQYTSNSYYNLAKEYNINPSMSRSGNCYDNAPAENFFGILKSECIKRFKIKTFDIARKLIAEYIYFYNNERIQLKTELTPMEKRCQFIVI